MQKTQSKKWYLRRRYWALALLAIGIYFCLIPSPLRVSPETTGFTSPLLPNGDVDYFGAYEQTYLHKLSPPEDNGQRLLIAALGPRILEQAFIADNVPWENMPTDERSKKWFHEQWVPLAEHMYFDPYARPRFFDLRDYYSFMRDEWKANNQDADAKYDYKEDEELRTKRLIVAPWTAEEYPVIARWLEERSPVLDLFGVAVRKPNFVCWRQRPEAEHFYFILLPEVQASRNFGRELPIRVTERLGRGDIDGAWDVVMSMFYLSRKHFIHDPLHVTNLVGMATEEAGWKSAQVVLQHGNPPPEQLERFAQDLASLPRRMTLVSDIERYAAYAVLQLLQSGNVEGLYELLGNRDNQSPYTDLTSFFIYLFGGVGDGGSYIPRYVTLLPFDRNIAGKRITEFLQTERRIYGDSTWHINSTVMRKVSKEMEQSGLERGWWTQRPGHLLRVPLIRTRSQLIADRMIASFLPALLYVHERLDRTNTQFDLLRLAVALERYKSAYETYPQTLDELVPTYLEEVPLDPFTGRLSWTYKVAPDAATAFLLHSSEWEEASKDKRKSELFIRRTK